MNLAEIFTTGSLQLASPWVLLLLPLPWLLRHWLPAANDNQEAALRVPDLADFEQDGGSLRQGSRFVLILFWLAWLALILAASRPQHVGEAIELPVSGRDLMLAIDLSGSMKTRDFQVKGQVINRLQATRLVASDFIERRVGDRIGLILFGEQAYLQSPLTFDRRTVQIFLEEAALGLAGRATAIGDAIGLSLKHLRQPNSTEADGMGSDRVLILLTDGDNTAGTILPRKAAELAQRENMKIYTIGIGANRGMPGMSGLLSRGRYSELDEATLKHIATITGGRYFRAHNTRELAEIYRELDKLEPAERDTRSYRPTRSLFTWPLAIALALSLLIAGIRWGQR